MKALVVFYSRSGTTKKVACELSRLLSADVDEILDVKSRGGPFGYLRSGKEASMKELPEIRGTTKNPSDYELVVVGTPIWSWTLSSPVRAYLVKNAGKFASVAFFCTQVGSGAETAFAEMEKLCGMRPRATLALTAKQVVGGGYMQELKGFVSQIP